MSDSVLKSIGMEYMDLPNLQGLTDKVTYIYVNISNIRLQKVVTNYPKLRELDLVSDRK